MEVIRGLEKLKKKYRSPVVTIGIFDGVHRGHRRVISRTIDRALAIGGTSIVLTFDPHPSRLVRPKTSSPLVISLHHRLALIEDLGVDICIVTRFNNSFAKQSAEKFVEEVLVRKLWVREILLGYNYAFGNDRRGDVELLRSLGDRYGFKVREVAPVKVAKQVVSSTLVRQCIEHGRLKEASRFLGRPFSILGTIVRGSRRGRLMGYPTANVNPHHEAIPPSGVYGARVKLNKRLFGGILNIGTRPTFGRTRAAEPTIEVHIFNFGRKIYGRDLEIIFLEKVRGERRFTTKDELIRQIKADEIKVKKILS